MRMILSLLTLVAVLFAAAVVETRAQGTPSAAEQEAIEKIESAGGSARRVAQNDDSIEVDFHLQGSSVTDKDLAPIAQLSNLVAVHLGNTGVTDEGLSHLKMIESLVRLHLGNTKISDAGLAHLKGLKNLTYLNLYGTEVSDAGLKHLRGLKKLEKLFVWQTQVTPAGVDRLRKALPNVDVNTGWELKQEASDGQDEEKPAGDKDP